MTANHNTVEWQSLQATSRLVHSSSFFSVLPSFQKHRDISFLMQQGHAVSNSHPSNRSRMTGLLATHVTPFLLAQRPHRNHWPTSHISPMQHQSTATPATSRNQLGRLASLCVQPKGPLYGPLQLPVHPRRPIGVRRPLTILFFIIASPFLLFTPTTINAPFNSSRVVCQWHLCPAPLDPSAQCQGP